jgi:aryl-alcohol dehydrogenase-like predicted oxidoreductase
VYSKIVSCRAVSPSAKEMKVRPYQLVKLKFIQQEASKGAVALTGLQIQYSLIERTPERELLPMAGALDIGVTAWSPLGGGILTGKYNKNNKAQLQKNTSSSPATVVSDDNNSRLNIQNDLANRFLNESQRDYMCK